MSNTGEYYAHQDWKTVTFQKATDSSSKNTVVPFSKEKHIEQKEEAGKIKKYTSIHRDNLQTYRRLHGKTQKELAQQCQIPIQKIQEIENGGIYDENIVQRINNRLKIKLSSDIHKTT